MHAKLLIIWVGIKAMGWRAATIVIFTAIQKKSDQIIAIEIKIAKTRAIN
jgi:hypothetical protein